MHEGMTSDMNNLLPSGHNKIFSALTILAAGILFSCMEDNPYKPPDPVETVDFGIVMFDETGTQGTSFRKGTDIKIGFKLITDGGDGLQWRTDDECRLLSSKSFLLVFQSFESLDKPPNLYVPLGTPHLIPTQCTTLNLPTTYINGGTVIFAFPWSGNPDNEPMVAGRYYATASFDLVVEGEIKHWDLRSDFEIYN